MRRIHVFDTTLRDGEQSLSHTFSVEQKVEIAQALAALGVDVIEAGFPCSSPGDFAAVRAVSASVRGVVVAGLSRAVPADIDACGEALREAEIGRIHTGIATSDLHMRSKLRKSRQEVLEIAESAVKLARHYAPEVEFYAEDAFRSDREFLAEVIRVVIRAGATVINVPDTVGLATPWALESLILWLQERVERLDQVTLSVHCHNDLGMATANTLAGVRAGATQVEVTVNGIGERAGNAALEEVALALRLHGTTLQVETGIRFEHLAHVSALVSEVSRVPISPFKPVVGSNAFSHASGIHQDGVLKDRETYEIIDPAWIGRARGQVVLTARSGRHALKVKAATLGWDLAGNDLDRVYRHFLAVADQEGSVDDARLARLLAECLSPREASRG